jgi:hypothetical protein
MHRFGTPERLKPVTQSSFGFSEWQLRLLRSFHVLVESDELEYEERPEREV